MHRWTAVTSTTRSRCHQLNVICSTMSFSIPPLPWAYDALVGKGISKEQVTYHYDKHHQGYVTKLNAAAKSNPELAKKSIETLIGSEKGPIFNLAAQIWNHTFYWNCL